MFSFNFIASIFWVNSAITINIIDNLATNTRGWNKTKGCVGFLHCPLPLLTAITLWCNRQLAFIVSSYAHTIWLLCALERQCLETSAYYFHSSLESTIFDSVNLYSLFSNLCLPSSNLYLFLSNLYLWSINN